MTMIGAIASALIFGAISSLTFLAYQHPGAYRKIHRAFEKLSVVFSVVFTIWYFAILAAEHIANDAVMNLKGIDTFKAIDYADSVRNAIADNLLPSLWILAGMAGFGLYLLFLLFLPTLLASDEDDKKDQNQTTDPEN